MDLVERYVQSVRFWLPRGQQDDVSAELAEDIRSQIEEQEAKVGRELTELEVASILKEHGRPILVAGRYRPQQWLIGPALFPIYRIVTIIVTVCYLIPWILTWWALVIFDPHYHADFGGTFGPLWGTFWVTTFTAFGVVTLIFAILERADAKVNFLRNWDPRHLPAVRDPNRISRLSSSIEIAANLGFALWWITDMWSTTVFNRAGVLVEFAPVWKTFLWAFLLLASANTLLAAVNLARPYWTWVRASIQLLLTSAGAVAFCSLFKAHLLVQIVVPHLAPDRAALIVNAINTNASKSFPFAVTACVFIVALSGVGRLIRLRTNRTKLIHRMAIVLLLAGPSMHARAEAQTPATALPAPIHQPSMSA